MNERQKELLDSYVAELREAKKPVNVWWARLVAVELARAPNKVAAANELRRRWPNGPATHPRVIAIVRKYYLACERMNDEIMASWGAREALAVDGSGAAPEEREGTIPPAFFVGECLVTKDTEDVANIIAHFKYWPIGMNANGSHI